MGSARAASFQLMPAAGMQEEQPPLWSVKRASEPQNGALGMMLE